MILRKFGKTKTEEGNEGTGAQSPAQCKYIRGWPGGGGVLGL